MIKIVPPHAWGPGDGLGAALVKASAAGFGGADFGAFVKRAGHPLADWVRHNRPGLGEEYVHLIAMGSTEKYGGNRNGDQYSRMMLERDHPTFEKYARWFVNHANSDPARSYGLVKKSFWNQDLERVELLCALNTTKQAAERNGGLIAERTLQKLASGVDLAVSQSCFPPGEPVLLADGREVPIEEVHHGDKVVTHLGNIKDVGHQVTIPYDGPLVRIRSSGIPGRLSATADHKIWVRPAYRGDAPCPVCGLRFKRLGCHFREKAADPAHRAAAADYGKAAEGWRRADEVRKGDYVRTPFDRAVGSDRGDPEYAVLLGYYAAEGSIYEYHRGKPDADWRQGADFTFGRTEKRYADRVVACVRNYGGVTVTAKVPRLRQGCYHVRVSGRLLRERLEADVGRYSYGKTFSAAVMGWAPENQLLLLGAFFDGDGTWHKTNERLVAVTVSAVMARQLLVMCWRNGIPATLNRFTSPAHAARGRRPQYTVEVSGRYATLIPTDKVPRGYQFATSSCKAVEHLRHQPAGRVAVRKSPAPLTYVEGDFAYHRVMTVETETYTGPVHNFGVADDESYVVRLVAVKNCRVPVDVCTSCGNRARTRAEYCGPERCKYGGCRDSLGRVFDDGFHLCVDNPKCTFFDISDVSDTRGADRTAFVTGKVAAAERVVGGAELAEMMNLVAPEYLLAPQAYAALRCLRKLAAAPPHPHEPAPWGLAVGVRAALAGKSAADLDPPAGASDADRHQRIGDLARAGVVLSPPAWLAMATGVAAEKCAAVFGGPVDPARDLLERADLHETLEAGALAGDSRLSAEKWAWAAATPRAVEREAALAVLAPVKAASDRAVPPAVRAEARARYVAYQANLLAASENSPKFDLLLSECARQNRNLSA